MKKLLLINITLLSTFCSFASDINLTKKIEKYCKDTKTKISIFKESLRLNGRIKVSNRIGKKRAKYSNYRGCHMDTPLINNTYKSLCIDKNIQDIDASNYPKMILWHFTGASFFNAELANTVLSPSNIKGYEGKELIVGFDNGVNQLKNIFDLNTELYNRDEVEFHYHAGSGLHSKENYSSAVVCAEETKRHIDIINTVSNINYRPTWVVTGFSNGGISALNFQNKLPEFNITVDHAIIVDPVAKVHKFAFYDLFEFSGERNPNTTYLEALYQNEDKYSLANTIALQGKPVKGADINIKIPANSFRYNVDQAHNYIYYTNEVEDSFRKLVTKFLN